MTPDEHRDQLAEVHARLAQTPQPVTVGLDPDAGLADMLTAARIAGSGDGQAILAGRPMAGERERCTCGHIRALHYSSGICLGDR